jgi:hypothetical protein
LKKLAREAVMFNFLREKRVPTHPTVDSYASDRSIKKGTFSSRLRTYHKRQVSKPPRAVVMDITTEEEEEEGDEEQEQEMFYYDDTELESGSGSETETTPNPNPNHVW